MSARCQQKIMEIKLFAYTEAAVVWDIDPYKKVQEVSY
jgi:hypothetical protein